MRNKNKFDDHHPFHLGRYWEQYEPGRAIRQAVIARGMGRAAHELLHVECSPVPPLSYESLAGVARQMDSEYVNVFQGIDDFSFAVDAISKHRLMKPGENQVNQLASSLLREQIPFIRDGLPSRKLYIVK